MENKKRIISFSIEDTIIRAIIFKHRISGLCVYVAKLNENYGNGNCQETVLFGLILLEIWNGKSFP